MDFNYERFQESKKQRIRELEDMFIRWANAVEDVLMNYKNLHKLSNETLLSDLEMYNGELKELRKFDIEFKNLTLSYKSHPDCSRAEARLNRLYYLAKKELISRMLF